MKNGGSGLPRNNFSPLILAFLISITSETIKWQKIKNKIMFCKDKKQNSNLCEFSSFTSVLNCAQWRWGHALCENPLNCCRWKWREFRQPIGSQSAMTTLSAHTRPMSTTTFYAARPSRSAASPLPPSLIE